MQRSESKEILKDDAYFVKRLSGQRPALRDWGLETISFSASCDQLSLGNLWYLLVAWATHLTLFGILLKDFLPHVTSSFPLAHSQGVVLCLSASLLALLLFTLLSFLSLELAVVRVPRAVRSSQLPAGQAAPPGPAPTGYPPGLACVRGRRLLAVALSLLGLQRLPLHALAGLALLLAHTFLCVVSPAVDGVVCPPGAAATAATDAAVPLNGSQAGASANHTDGAGAEPAGHIVPMAWAEIGGVDPHLDPAAKLCLLCINYLAPLLFHATREARPLWSKHRGASFAYCAFLTLTGLSRLASYAGFHALYLAAASGASATARGPAPWPRLMLRHTQAVLSFYAAGLLLSLGATLGVKAIAYRAHGASSEGVRPPSAGPVSCQRATPASRCRSRPRASLVATGSLTLAAVAAKLTVAADAWSLSSRPATPGRPGGLPLAVAACGEAASCLLCLAACLAACLHQLSSGRRWERRHRRLSGSPLSDVPSTSIIYKPAALAAHISYTPTGAIARTFAY
uniref:Uncharacterized protein LOC116940565 isoform X1 n=1 Tax=Petromyzon marinus TaxID=7757 RepID=A0AAJ7SVP3_PETMA|nr:uncharacterized protein LOC116940565 isoform X1 [Petromyzon marinus]